MNITLFQLDSINQTYMQCKGDLSPTDCTFSESNTDFIDSSLYRSLTMCITNPDLLPFLKEKVFHRNKRVEVSFRGCRTEDSRRSKILRSEKEFETSWNLNLETMKIKLLASASADIHKESQQQYNLFQYEVMRLMKEGCFKQDYLDKITPPEDTAKLNQVAEKIKALKNERKALRESIKTHRNAELLATIHRGEFLTYNKLPSPLQDEILTLLRENKAFEIQDRFHF